MLGALVLWIGEEFRGSQSEINAAGETARGASQPTDGHRNGAGRVSISTAFILLEDVRSEV